MTLEQKIKDLERHATAVRTMRESEKELQEALRDCLAMLKKSIEQTMHYRNLIFARHVSSTIGLDTLIKSDDAELLRAGEGP